MQPSFRLRPAAFAAVIVLLASSLVAQLLPSSVASSAPIEGTLIIDRVTRANGPIALVGDSLTYSYIGGLPASFSGQQWGPFAIEARSARRTLVTAEIATSGIDAVRRIRQNGFDAPTWIVALGTNDMLVTYRSPGAVDALIDTMLSEIGVGRRVVWVNVYSRNDPLQTAAFNAALEGARLRHPTLVVADWATAATTHPEWIGRDGVHPTAAGAIAHNELLAGYGLLAPCPAVPTGAAPSAPALSLDAAGAAATATAQRLCRVTP